MSHAGITRAALALAALALGACSAIVQPPGSELRCEPGADGADPCPGELVCTDAGVCDMPTGNGGDCEDVPDGGTGEEEICNGIDDDCDGTLDEGQDFDGDGFTWCGSGDMARQDCDDNDPMIFPAGGGEFGGTERCNGQDDDCDDVIDEDPPSGALCGAEEQCLPLEGGCVVPDCTITGCGAGERCDLAASPPACTTEGPARCEDNEDCDPGMVCDTATGNCFEPKPLGESCTVDAECDSELCMSASALRVGEGRVCGRACCSSAGCPPGMVCWVSGTGARSCLPPDVAGVSAPGSSQPAAACASGDECPSGICGGSEIGCVGHCSSDAQCGGRACTITEYQVAGGHQLTDFVCGEAPGDGELGDSCDRGSDCRSGICVDVPFDADYCSRPCGSPADCPSGAICDWAQFEGDDDYINVCFYSFSSPEPLCCSDGQCDSGQRCQEVNRSGRWEMRCQ